MQAVAFATSHIGRRANNEDAFCVAPHLGLYAVADGMGGHEGGEVASRLAIDALLRHLERGTSRTGVLGDDLALSGAVRVASDDIVANAVGALEEMGTTLAAVWLRGDHALIAHVGDSRVYRLRDGRLTALTRDHSMINELEAQGSGRLVALLRDRISHVVTRCISAGCNSEPDVRRVDIQSRDVFLVCSDGLSDVLTDAEIEGILSTSSPERAHGELVDRAYARGGTDNITAVVVRVP